METAESKTIDVQLAEAVLAYSRETLLRIFRFAENLYPESQAMILSELSEMMQAEMEACRIRLGDTDVI